VAEAAKALSLRYLVITSVDRDDLPDFGASGFAKTIRAIKKADPGIIVEALIPDFQGDDRALKMVVEAEPKVIGHNLETVHRLTPRVRDHRVSYQLSLQVLDKIKGIGADVITKSGLMLGLGETEKDIKEAILDIRRVGVDILTLGQYLQPTPNNLPVERYWTPQEFKELEQMAEAIGFPAVASAPLVRSSYKAQELWEKVLIH
jgi:lipoic acid synthetase